MANSKTCVIADCEGRARRKGLCDKHNSRLRRHGNPLMVKKRKSATGAPHFFLTQKAISFVGNECLLWPFGKNKDGYGIIAIRGETKTVHRLVCIAVNGKPPTDKHESTHVCGNRWCVNPQHLKWGTHRENMADRIFHGTDNRGERHNHAKLTASDVQNIRRAIRTERPAAIAARYGVSTSAIYAIDKKISWAWLEENDCGGRSIFPDEIGPHVSDQLVND